MQPETLGCSSRKIVYTSRREALTDISRKKNKLEPTGHGRTRLRPYRCPECDNWHLGHGRR